MVNCELMSLASRNFLAGFGVAQLSYTSMLNDFKLKNVFRIEFGETVFG